MLLRTYFSFVWFWSELKLFQKSFWKMCLKIQFARKKKKRKVLSTLLSFDLLPPSLALKASFGLLPMEAITHSSVPSGPAKALVRSLPLLV